MKNPLNFIKKANKSLNLYLENFKKNQNFIRDYYKNQEILNNFISEHHKDHKRLEQLMRRFSKDIENFNIIDKARNDTEVKKEYFFKGKKKKIKEFFEDFPHITTDSIYDLCVYNDISFLTIIPNKNRIYFKTKDGIILTTNQNLFVLKEIFTRNSYLSPKLYEYEEFVFFDVGMHRGYASLAIGQMSSCKAVYGFEIDSDTFNFAQENFALNPQISKKIYPHQFGLLDSDKEVDIYAIPLSDGRTTIEDNILNLNPSEREEYTINKRAEVKQASKVLTQIIEKDHITSKIVLKIDTEGAEYDILKDLYHSGVLNKIDLIMGECHDGMEKLEDYLNDFNLVLLEYQFNSKDICTFYYEREKK